MAISQKNSIKKLVSHVDMVVVVQIRAHPQQKLIKIPVRTQSHANCVERQQIYLREKLENFTVFTFLLGFRVYRQRKPEKHGSCQQMLVLVVEISLDEH